MDKDASRTLEKLVETHGKRLYNLAYRICGDETLAEDLLQESLLEIYKALPRFEGRSSAYTWAYKITLQTCLNRTAGERKREQAQAALHRKDEALPDEDLIPDTAPPPEDELVKNALMAEIREKCHYFMLYKLTDEQRVVILLRDLFEFSYGDMAYVLDISEDTVRSRLSRARNSLKRYFDKRCSWIDPKNPCTCRDRVGYTLQKYPALMKHLSHRTERPEYNKAIADQISHKIESERDIIAAFPELDFKARKSMEIFMKKSVEP